MNDEDGKNSFNHKIHRKLNRRRVDFHPQHDNFHFEWHTQKKVIFSMIRMWRGLIRYECK